MSEARLLLSFHGKVGVERPALRRRLLNRWSAARADAILAVSHESAEMMRREWGVPPGRLTVLHNGVDVGQFRPAPREEIHAERECLGLSMQHRVVVCLANLVPVKAIDVLIRAWAQVKADDPAARLLLVGDGPLRADLEAFSQRMGCGESVRFLGACDDAPALLRSADLSVLPSRYEACSNAVLESMASGLPVVACDAGGNRELIESGRTGWLVRPDSPEELADAIGRALMDENGRRRAGAAARETAVKAFGADRWVEAYTRLYLSLASRGTRSAQAAELAACAE